LQYFIFSEHTTTPSPLRGTPPIRGEISSLIGEGDHEVVERLFSDRRLTYPIFPSLIREG